MVGTSLLDYMSDMTGTARRRPDLSLLADFSKAAARDYLSNQVSMNESIVKLAQAHGLTPDDVNTVVAEANKAVHAHLFKTSANKYVTFDLADPKVILESLQAPVEKTASVHEDDFRRPPRKNTCVEKYASASRQGSNLSAKQEVYFAHEKLAQQAGALKDEIAWLNTRITGGEERFVKIARNMLLSQDFSERKRSLPFLYKFAMDAGLTKERTQPLIEKLALVLEGQGVIEKVAMSEVDPSLISDEIARTTKVTNGQHPLYILINTLKSDYDRRDMWTDKANKIKTDMGELQERLTQL